MGPAQISVGKGKGARNRGVRYSALYDGVGGSRAEWQCDARGAILGNRR